MTLTTKRSAILCGALTLALLGGCTCHQNQPAPVAAEPAPAAAPAPAPEPETTTETFSLNSEQLFDFDKSTLRPEGVASLTAVIERHMQNDNVRSISVVGHTDSRGSDAYNQALSERRANAVRDFIAEHGVDGSKISASGRGESSPVASNDTDEGRQKNRRVEITAELVRNTTK